MCEGKPQKEQFLILIDSCRKSLSIESMDDVELLVETFYEFGEKKKKRLEEEEEQRLAEKEENQSNHNVAPTNAKDAKKDAKGKDNKNPPAEEPKIEDEEEEEKDPTKPDIDLDDVVECLQEFNKKREEKLNSMDVALANPALKKKSNFQTEEQKVERQKKEEKMFWERMTKVLSDKGHALWRALDKGLTKYYALLVERQNLIEETGLLNQQNEELKTLLN